MGPALSQRSVSTMSVPHSKRPAAIGDASPARFWRLRLRAAAWLSGCFLLPFSILGQTTVEWKNNGTTSIDSGSNWLGGAVPTAAQIALFTSATFSPNGLQPQSASVSFAGIRLASGAGALTFTGPGGGSAKSISLGSSGVVNSSANTLTFDITSKVNIVLTANASFTADGPIAILDDTNRGSTTGFNIGAFTLTLDGASTESEIEKGFVGTGGSVVKSGTGTWTIGGANSYTGSTTLSEGILSVSSLANGGTASNLGKSTNAAANLIFNGGTLQYTGAAVSTDRLFTLGGNGGVIEASGSGALTFAATGSIAFSGANTSPTLTLSGSGTGNTLGPVVGNNGSGATSLTKSDSGSWTLAGANTLVGTVTVSAGTLTVSAGASLGGSGIAVVLTGGALNLNQSAQTIASLSGTAGTLSLGTGHTLTVSQSASTTFAGVLSGAGNFVKAGSGSLTLSGSNNFTGTTTVNAGALTISNDGNLGTAPGSATPAKLTLNGGTLASTAGFTLHANRGIALGTAGGTLQVDSGTLAYAGIIAGSGALAKSGTGVLALSTSNTYTGGTTVSGGLIELSGDAALGTGALTINGGGIRFGAAFNNLRTFALGSAGATLDTNGNSVSYSPVISGTGVLTKSGAGTLTLTAANTLTGGVTVNEGTLTVSSGSLLAAAVAPVTIAGGTLELKNAAQTIASLQFASGDLRGSSNLTLSGAGSHWSGGAMNATGSLIIGEGANLTISGAGVDHDFNGRTVTNQGTVNWTGGNLRAGSGSIWTNTGILNDQNTAAATISIPGTFGGTFTFTNAGTYAKTGSGSTSVQVPFTNTGTISVEAGTLTFTGSFTNTNGSFTAGGGTLVFASGLNLGTGALGGSGTVTAPLVTAGGQVTPGSSPGRLTINGDLTLLSTSTLLIEIGGGSQGVNYDFLSVSGNAQIGGELRLSFVNGYQSSVSATETFTILTAGSFSDAKSHFFHNVAPGQRLATTDGFGSFEVNFGTGAALSGATNSIVLSNFVAVPEPSTWALIIAGGAMVFFRVRRRR